MSVRERSMKIMKIRNTYIDLLLKEGYMRGGVRKVAVPVKNLNEISFSHLEYETNQMIWITRSEL